MNTAAQKGWNQLQNSDLLSAAEDAGFDVFVTTDKNLRYQQNLRGRKIAIVVLGTPRWPVVQLQIETIATAINGATPGSYVELEISIE